MGILNCSDFRCNTPRVREHQKKQQRTARRGMTCWRLCVIAHHQYQYHKDTQYRNAILPHICYGCTFKDWFERTKHPNTLSDTHVGTHTAHHRHIHTHAHILNMHTYMVSQARTPPLLLPPCLSTARSRYSAGLFCQQLAQANQL